MSSSNVASWPAYKILWRQMRWSGIPIALWNFQFVVIHTVNKAEVDVSQEISCFFCGPVDVGNLISGSSAFSKFSLNIWSSWFSYCWSLAWRILNALVITNTLFQEHKRRLYTWRSPNGQYWNQINYILCSQRWRRSIQSARTRLGVDVAQVMNSLLQNSDVNWTKLGKPLDHSHMT